MVTMSSNTAGYVFKKIIEILENYVLRSELSQGSLKLSFIVVLVVGTQLLVTISISRAVIFLLLMTSGDVERNPGPEQTLRSRCNSSSFALWLSAHSFCDKLLCFNTFSGSFHPYYSLRILLFAISMQLFFQSGKSNTYNKIASSLGQG